MLHVPPPNADLAEIAALLGDDNARILVRTFLREYPLLLRQLATGDRRTQHRIAHSLKSNARVIGARDLSARMAAFEARLSSDAGADIDASELAEISTSFDAASEPLRTYVGP